MSALRFGLLITLISVSTGCGKTVGDTCSNNSACGAGLICDLSVKDGYCTRSPCRKGECPQESVCVDFGVEASWCMRRCDSGQGCRSGLICMSGDSDELSVQCLDDLKTCQFCGFK